MYYQIEEMFGPIDEIATVAISMSTNDGTLLLG